MATYQHIIEIEPGRWACDANAAPLALPAEPCVEGCSLTCLIPIRKDDQVSDVRRQFECAEPRRRKCCPSGVPGRDHGRETGLDTLADHEHIAGHRKSHGAATAWTE